MGIREGVQRPSFVARLGNLAATIKGRNRNFLFWGDKNRSGYTKRGQQHTLHFVSLMFGGRRGVPQTW
jgi:hypothetical protein